MMTEATATSIHIWGICSVLLVLQKKSMYLRLSTADFANYSVAVYER
jgi:hypothetical protein